jgi:hypothetical protein
LASLVGRIGEIVADAVHDERVAPARVALPLQRQRVEGAGCGVDIVAGADDFSAVDVARELVPVSCARAGECG